MRHLLYIIYGVICSIPYFLYLQTYIDVRYLSVIMVLFSVITYLGVVMLHYKQVAIFYFINVSTGFMIYLYGTTLNITGFNEAAYILSAVIMQFILFVSGYSIASIFDEI